MSSSNQEDQSSGSPTPSLAEEEMAPTVEDEEDNPPLLKTVEDEEDDPPLLKTVEDEEDDPPLLKALKKKKKAAKKEVKLKVTKKKKATTTSNSAEAAPKKKKEVAKKEAKLKLPKKKETEKKEATKLKLTKKKKVTTKTASPTKAVLKEKKKAAPVAGVPRSRALTANSLKRKYNKNRSPNSQAKAPSSSSQKEKKPVIKKNTPKFSTTTPGSALDAIKLTRFPRLLVGAPPTKKPEGPSELSEEQEEIDIGGRSIVLAMSDDDLEEFLERVSRQCPIDDLADFRRREGRINWNEVAFSYYGPVQCKKAWKFLRSHARKYRIMHEIVEEVRFSFRVNYNRFVRKVIETAPGFPKRPYCSGGFHVYARELWEKHAQDQTLLNQKIENFGRFALKCQKEWLSLPEEVQEEYHKKSAIIQAEYQQKVKEYYLKFPTLAISPEKLDKDGELTEQITEDILKRHLNRVSTDLYADAPKFPLPPSELYINSKINDLDPPPTLEEMPELIDHFKKRWTDLKDKKRLKWIENCLRRTEDYIEEIKKYKKTRPLFTIPKDKRLHELLTKEEFKLWTQTHGEPPKLGVKTPNINMEQKREFRKDFTEYCQSIPYALKAHAINTLPKFMAKWCLEDVDTYPLVLDTELPEHFKYKPSRRRPYVMAIFPSVKKARESQGLVEENMGTENQEQVLDKDGDSVGIGQNPEIQEEPAENNKDQREKVYCNYRKKMSASTFHPGKKIYQHDLNDAIRGFFDGCQSWRNFSVYYYYAKYVSCEATWVKLFTENGIVPTATRIIETFHRLEKRQQQSFLDEAFAFYTQARAYNMKEHERDFTTPPKAMQYFPDEPKPPPKDAAALYRVDVKKAKRYDRAFEAPEWEELDEKTQMTYMKKFYWLNKAYISEYERFVKNMTPNDLVEYVVQKCQDWDASTTRRAKYFNNRPDLALEALAHPSYARSTFTAGVSDDEQEEAPQVYVLPNKGIGMPWQLKNHGYRFKDNPFTHLNATGGRPSKNHLVKRLVQKKQYIKNVIKQRKRQADWKPKSRWWKPIKRKPAEDPDETSSCEEEEEFGNLGNDNYYKKLRKFRQELLERQRYYYPLEEFYSDSVKSKLSKSKFSDCKKFLWLPEEEKAEKDAQPLRLISYARDLYHEDIKKYRRPKTNRLMTGDVQISGEEARRKFAEENGLEPPKRKRGRPPKKSLTSTCSDTKDVVELDEGNLTPTELPSEENGIEQPKRKRRKKSLKSTCSDTKDVVQLDEDEGNQTPIKTPSVTNSSPIWTPIATPKDDQPRHPRLALVTASSSSSQSVSGDESLSQYQFLRPMIPETSHFSRGGRDLLSPPKQEILPHSSWSVSQDDFGDMDYSSAGHNYGNVEDFPEEQDGIFGLPFANQFTEQELQFNEF